MAIVGKGTVTLLCDRTEVTATIYETRKGHEYAVTDDGLMVVEGGFEWTEVYDSIEEWAAHHGIAQ